MKIIHICDHYTGLWTVILPDPATGIVQYFVVDNQWHVFASLGSTSCLD